MIEFNLREGWYLSPSCPPTSSRWHGSGSVGGRPGCPAPRVITAFPAACKRWSLWRRQPELLILPGLQHHCAILQDLGEFPHAFLNPGQGEWRKPHLATIVVWPFYTRVPSSEQCMSLVTWFLALPPRRKGRYSRLHGDWGGGDRGYHISGRGQIVNIFQL